MDDIIWVTYRGRHIPIKPGMKAKFKKKELEKVKKEKASKEAIKNQEIRKKYGDLSEKSRYEDAQDDLVMNKGYSIEESEKILGKYEEIYKNSPKGKEIRDKLTEVQSKIDKLSNKDSKNIKYEDRDVKVTGLDTDYEENKELKDLYDEKDSYERQLESVGRRGSRATLSEYYKYFLSMGYSKETALEYAEEQVRKRKNK